MKAIRNTETNIVYLVGDDDITSGYLHDAASTEADGYVGDDYSFSNSDGNGLMEDVMKEYEKQYGKKNWKSMDIEVVDATHVNIFPEPCEHDTQMEKFFNDYAEKNAVFSEGKYMNYWDGHNNVSIILDCPDNENTEWEILSDEETEKYVSLYEKAKNQFGEFEHGYRKCNIDGYSITQSQWESDFEIASIDR